MSARFHSFEHRLAHFCELLKYCDKTNLSHVSHLHDEFVRLKHVTRMFTTADFEPLSAVHKTLCYFFELGKDHEHRFCAQPVSLVDGNPHASAERLADYLRSSEGWKLIRQSRLTNILERQRLQDMLGEDAFDLIEEFLVQSRTHLFMHILGYAHTGVARDDLDVYQSYKILSPKVFKYRNQSRDDFLTERLLKMDGDFVFVQEQDGARTTANAGMFTDRFKEVDLPILTGTPPQRSDVACINRLRKSVVFVGNLDDPLSQQRTTQAFKSFEALAQQPTVDGVANEVFEYQASVCWMAGGLFPKRFHEDRLKGVLGSLLTVFSRLDPIDGMEDAVRRSLVYTVGGEGRTALKQLWEACDIDQHDTQSREVAGVFLKNIIYGLEFLNANPLSGSVSKDELVLHGIVREALAAAAQKYFTLFPLLGEQDLTLAERRKLGHVAQLAGKIAATTQPFVDAGLTTEWAGTLSAAHQMYGPSKVDSTARRLSDAVWANKNQHVFSPTLLSQLQNQCAAGAQLQHQQHAVSEFLMERSGNTAVPECVVEFLGMARADAFNNPLPSPEKTREFFADVQRMLGGKKSLNALSSQEATLNNPRSAFCRWVTQVALHIVDKPTAAGGAVLVLSDLFNKSLWQDRSLLPYSPRMRSVMDNLARLMIEQSLHPDAQPLRTLLEQIYAASTRTVRVSLTSV